VAAWGTVRRSSEQHGVRKPRRRHASSSSAAASRARLRATPPRPRERAEREAEVVAHPLGSSHGEQLLRRARREGCAEPVVRATSRRWAMELWPWWCSRARTEERGLSGCLPSRCWSWKTKLISEAHLSVTGAAGPSCRGWREWSKAGVATTFHVLMLTRRQRVELAWHATCTKVINI